MKMLSVAVLASALALAVGIAMAQDTKAPPASSGAQPACCMDSKAQMGQMDEHMQRMRALHEKMANASPEERQKLMAEQRQEMQQGMAMMQQMQHGAMMGGATMGGPGMGPTRRGTTGASGQKPAPADQRAQMQMMEKRLDMMQMMMESMMDQQSGMGAGAMPGPSK